MIKLIQWFLDCLCWIIREVFLLTSLRNWINDMKKARRKKWAREMSEDCKRREQEQWAEQDKKDEEAIWEMLPSVDVKSITGCQKNITGEKQNTLIEYSDKPEFYNPCPYGIICQQIDCMHFNPHTFKNKNR